MIKQQDNLHLAPYVVLANVAYKDKHGTTKKRTTLQVDRCFSSDDAKKVIARIKKTVIMKQVGYDNNGPVYEKSFGKAWKLSLWNQTGGGLTEYIEGFSIVEKDLYFKTVK